VGNEIVDRILERADREKSDSEFSYFFSLLLAGEAMMKVAVAGIPPGFAPTRATCRRF